MKRHTQRRLTTLAALVVLLLSLACFKPAPGYRVVSPGAPNALSNVSTVYVRPLVLGPMTINDKPEAEWVADRSNRQTDAWNEDRNACVENFARSVAEVNQTQKDKVKFVLSLSTETVPPGALVLETVITEAVYLYRPPIAGGTKAFLTANLTVKDAAGTVLEVVQLGVDSKGNKLAVAGESAGLGGVMRNGCAWFPLVEHRYLSARIPN